MINEKLALPKMNNFETVCIIDQMYDDFGTIENCKTLEDFGAYRRKLISYFDNKISELKKGKS